MTLKALVVDDNLLNAKLLTAFLKKLDCSVDIAQNGKQAFDKTNQASYDICFMDIQMPVMDGIEATQKIRKHISQDLPIIAVTAISDFTQEKSLGTGMNDFMRKPVDFTLLKDILHKYCLK